MDEEQCPRCPNFLTLDEECGFLLCSSCGYVQDEVRLVHHSAAAGVNVGDNVAGSGGGALVAVGEAGGYRPGTGLAATSSERERTTKRSLDKLRGVASTLSLSPGLVADAESFFKEMRDRRLLPSGGGGDNTMESQVAAVLFLTVRSHQQPITLSEVAAACHANPKTASRHFTALVNTLGLPGFIPSASIRAFAMRLAAKLLDTLNCGEGPRAEHPYVKECVAVAELASKLGLGEGRQPGVIAAGCLLWVAETGLSKKHLPSRINYTHAIHTVSSVSLANVLHTSRMVAQSVLQVAQLLPMGSHLTESNLLHYFPVVASLVHTLAALRRTPAPGPPLLEGPPGWEEGQASGAAANNREGVRGSGAAPGSVADAALLAPAPATATAPPAPAQATDVGGTEPGAGEHGPRKRAAEDEGGEGPSEGKRARKGRFQGLPQHVKALLTNK